MNSYHFSFRRYRRPFRTALRTSHGIWEVREGIVIKIMDEMGNYGWGEIAPIPWFGSETLPEALTFCDSCLGVVPVEIPPSLPACQFAFESAMAELHYPYLAQMPTVACSYLLPAGNKAIDALLVGWQKGARTFKWKIGVEDIREEIKICKELLKKLPLGYLRLDANGGLNYYQTQLWLDIVNSEDSIEFIEQPLGGDQWEKMLALSTIYGAKMALDESVANLEQLQDCYNKGWGGLFVVKAAIAGSPQKLRQFCRDHSIDLVLSSVLETPIAKRATLHLALELSYRTPGFGVGHFF